MMVILGINQLNPIVKILKKRFNNLNAVELTQIATDILNEINKQLKEESES